MPLQAYRVKVPPYIIKDTVLVAHSVLGRARHVQQDQLGLPGLLQDDLVQSQRCVHAPQIKLVPRSGGRRNH